MSTLAVNKLKKHNLLNKTFAKTTINDIHQPGSHKTQLLPDHGRFYLDIKFFIFDEHVPCLGINMLANQFLPGSNKGLFIQPGSQFIAVNKATQRIF